MPPDTYVGAAIGAIILVLLVALFWPKRAQRQVVSKTNGPDPVAVQLSRIADALETLAAHVGASPVPLQKTVQKAPAPSHLPVPQVSEPLFQNLEPPSPAIVEQPPAVAPTSASGPTLEPAPEPPQQASEAAAVDPAPTEPTPQRRVKLSMFGR